MAVSAQNQSPERSEKREMNEVQQAHAVGVGKKVLLEVNSELQSWEIVDAGKSDITNGKISSDAPLARCILGAKKGDMVECKIMYINATIIVKKVSLFYN